MCGTMVPSKYENRIPDLSNAANRFQLNFVKELRVDNTVDFMSYVGMNVAEDIRNELQDEIGDAKYYFKSNHKIKSAITYMMELKRLLRNADCLMTYNLVYAWLFAPWIAKWMHRKSVLILADYTPAEAFPNLARKLYTKLEMILIRQFDVVIGLSEGVRACLTPTQNFLCMEGGIDQDVYDYFAKPLHVKSNRDTISYMYAGVLEPVTGIDLLLKAFAKNHNANIRLKISGKGSLVDMVLEAAKNDSRITYLGCVPYEEYLSNLEQADVLVNPRNMNFPENQYNFPSKIMEYLATGKPIISTRFPGWEKYNEYIIFCESTVEDIREKISGTIENEDVFDRNRRFAQKFIWTNQVKKIQQVLKEIS